MRRSHSYLAIAVLAGSVAYAMPASAGIVDNANLVHGVYFGSGNGALPQEFTVNTMSGIELGLRAHISNGSPAAGPQLVPTGNTYFVPLGNTFNFDFSVDPSAGGTQVSLTGSTALLTITNLLTHATFSFDPTNALLGNNYSLGAPGGYQNSERVSFSFLGLGYNPNLNDTYSVNLSLADVPGVGTISDQMFVQIGSGVPEPQTWAMMVLGFFGIGFMAYRRKMSGQPFRLA